MKAILGVFLLAYSRYFFFKDPSFFFLALIISRNFSVVLLGLRSELFSVLRGTSLCLVMTNPRQVNQDRGRPRTPFAEQDSFSTLNRLAASRQKVSSLSVKPRIRRDVEICPFKTHRSLWWYAVTHAAYMSAAYMPKHRYRFTEATTWVRRDMCGIKYPEKKRGSGFTNELLKIPCPVG